MASQHYKHAKPLPLKQRTSSVDPRRDHDFQTVLSLVKLIKPREFFVTVDTFSIWRRHLFFALEDGADLRSYMTQRYASSMVFLSLLLGTELNVLFNSATVTTHMRQQLFAENFRTVEFWTGVTILISVIVTILGLMSVFTAWGMVSSLSDANAKCILRSSIGQYVAELPGRFIVSAIYSFLLWVILFFFLLLPPGFWSGLLAFVTLGLFIHVASVFSMFGRIIMHSSAMGSHRIFDEDFERTLLPVTLHNNLRSKALASLNNNVSIIRQYRSKKPLDHNFTPSDLDSSRSAGSTSSDGRFSSADAAPSQTGITRPRADSAVRFADNLWSSASTMRETSTSQQPNHKQKSPPRRPTSSVTMSEKPQDLSLRPPRPLPLRVSNPVASTSSDSVPSLEDWLRASNSEGQSGSTGFSDRDTPANNPAETVESLCGPGKTKEEPTVEVPAHIPFDSADWPPLTGTLSDQINSHSSSTGSLEHEARPLTDDEKFDLEYGDIGRENHEQQHLLGDDDVGTDYSTLRTPYKNETDRVDETAGRGV